MPGARSEHEQSGLGAMIASLERTRAAARAMLIGQRALGVALGVAAGALLLGALDFALRFPAWIRWFHLTAGAAALLVILVRRVLPAIRFRPTLTSVALRVEGLRPELRGELASAVEFARGARGAGMESALSGAVVARVAGARGLGSSALNPRRLYERLGQCALAALALVAIALMQPELTRIGAARLLAPWAGVDWPKRTEIADATGARVHARGGSLALRAALLRTSRGADDTRVMAEHRTIDDAGRVSPTRTTLLTHQRRSVPVASSAGGRPASREGALFERLIEPEGEWVEYRLTTADDATAWARVRIVDPPAVASARATLTPPEYARGSASGALFGAGEFEMGAGTDERATAPGALAGTRVELALTLNKPIDARSDDEGWIETTLGEDAAGAGVEIASAGNEWTLRWTLESSARLTVRLIDEHGIGSAEDAVYRFDASPDREPSVAILEPPADTTALATARLDVRAEGRDEVGLDSVWIERRIARPLGVRQPSGPGGAVEPEEHATEVSREAGAGARSAEARATMDLGALGVKPGDEVWLVAAATDILAASGGERGPARSAPRKVRILSEADLIEEVQSELSSLRQSAIRVEAQQGEVQDRTRVRGSDRRTRSGQSAVGERLTRARESVQRLRERVERNGLEDERLERMLQEVGGALGQAGESSARASEGLERAAQEARRQREAAGAKGEEGERADDDATALTEDEAKAVADEQQRVRDELASLIEALDAGQDGWVARRQVERMLEEQRALRERTRSTGAQTAGLKAERLTPEQREALAEIARAQRDLSENARRLTDEMPAKAEEVRKQDPAAAAGLEQAARSAQRGQVSQQMSRAADQAEQNQTGDAARAQQQAEQTLEDMLRDMERGEQSRRERLRRQLASLIASIEGLIERQNVELAALEGAPEQVAPLAPAMMALNRNTIAVAGEAREAGRETAPVARLVSRAGEHQAEAIGALRAERRAEAGERELDAVARLTEALEEARRADAEQQAQDEQQKRTELRKSYAALLERQTAARDRAATYAGMAELSLRDRAGVRALGEEQASIRESLDALLKEVAELAESPVFEFAHRRLDGATGAAAEALRAGEPRGALPEQERAIRSLRDLVAALAEGSDRKKPFDEAGGGASASGGGQSGQSEGVFPPLAQLRLLRAIQGDIAEDTRFASQRGAKDVARLERLAREQRELAERGQALIDQMSQQGGGGFKLPGAEDEKAPEPEKAPGDAAPNDNAESGAPGEEPGDRSPAPEPAPEPQPEETP